MTEPGCDSCFHRKRDRARGAEYCGADVVRCALPAGRLCGNFKAVIGDKPLWLKSREETT